MTQSTSAPTATTSEPSFRELEDRLLDHYGVDGVSRFVTLAEPPMRVHLIETGTGEPVIALHGGDGEAVDWAPLFAELQSSLHIYAVDRPGFGLTDPFDYRDVDMRRHASSFVVSLLDAIGLRTATLAGGSMGGYFALVTALDHPERVDKLILVGMAAGLLTELPEALVGLGTSPEAAAAFMDSVDSIDGQKNQYRQMFSVDVDAVPQLYFDTRLAGLRRPGAKQTWATLLQRLVDAEGKLHPAFNLVPELPKIPHPTLVIWGERDMAGAEVGERAAQLLPDGRVTVIPGIGHFPFLEAPQECASAMLEFLRS